MNSHYARSESDPAGFLDFDGLMLIDEVQRVPDLWLAIKNALSLGDGLVCLPISALWTVG